MNGKKGKSQPDKKKPTRPKASNSSKPNTFNVSGNEHHAINDAHNAGKVNNEKQAEGRDNKGKWHFLKDAQFWYNIIILGFTAFTYYKTTQQTDIAKDAANAAIEANDIAKTQYAESNVSYLEINEPYVNVFEIEKNIGIIYKISNSGSQAIRIDSVATQLAEYVNDATTHDAETVMNGLFDFTYVVNNRIATQSNSIPIIITKGPRLNKAAYDNFINGKEWICLMTKIKYTMISNGETGDYINITRIISNGQKKPPYVVYNTLISKMIPAKR